MLTFITWLDVVFVRFLYGKVTVFPPSLSIFLKESNYAAQAEEIGDLHSTSLKVE